MVEGSPLWALIQREFSEKDKKSAGEELPDQHEERVKRMRSEIVEE